MKSPQCVVDKTWQLNSITKRFLCCLLAKATLVNTTKLQKLYYRPLMQARCQNSVTRGAEINFGGTREVYLREFFKSGDQTKKVKTKKKVFSSKIFTNSGFHFKILRFSTNPKAKTKKKGLRPQSFMKSGVNPKNHKKQFLLANF